MTAQEQFMEAFDVELTDTIGAGLLKAVEQKRRLVETLLFVRDHESKEGTAVTLGTVRSAARETLQQVS